MGYWFIKAVKFPGRSTHGLVLPPPARHSALRAWLVVPPHRRPCGTHNRWNEVSSYPGLRYNAKTCACPETVDTRTGDKPTASNHAAHPFQCQAFFPYVLGENSMAACWNVDSSFFTARLGPPAAPAVCLCAPIPPLTKVPARSLHTFWLSQPKLTRSYTTDTGQVYPFAFIFLLEDPCALQLFPACRGDDENTRQWDKRWGMGSEMCSNVLKLPDKTGKTVTSGVCEACNKSNTFRQT